jgi:phosphoribosylaminoimidazole-succinocarboxamide synthase
MSGIDQSLLYSGKAKSVYLTDHPDQLRLHFRDDTSAFDGKKLDQLARKGEVNNQFNAFIMQKLEEEGIHTHWIQMLSATDSLVKRLKMLPLECVIRNVTAGGICRRLGVPEGVAQAQPIFEFFLKNDALGDPMVNEDHILAFGWATSEQIATMKRITHLVNDYLKNLFAKAGMILVDYKLEFGEQDGQMILGDEITPDGCRIWDAETLTKLDKDRFRQDLGGVIDAYLLLAQRLGIELQLTN